MKLLILTQKVDINDDVLGFMHGWIREFAKNCESVIVVCLRKGEYDLPKNVKVLSLGKERGESRIKYFINFYKYILRERNNYNKVFVHMNYEYLVLGGLLWRLMGKKISLWYAHGHTPFSLRIAEKFAHVIFTSTKSGFRLKSEKVNVIGQGIDVDRFRIKNEGLRIKNNKFKIITVGRISPIKDYETLVKAVEVLRNENMNLRVDIIGGAGLPEQEKYLTGLKKIVEEKKLERIISFIGAVPNKDIVEHLASVNLFISASRTGSLDKAILEAMACGIPVLTCNESMSEVLGGQEEKIKFPAGDYNKLAVKIKIIFKMSNKERCGLGIELRKIVEREHSLSGLINKILNQF